MFRNMINYNSMLYSYLHSMQCCILLDQLCNQWCQLFAMRPSSEP